MVQEGQIVDLVPTRGNEIYYGLISSGSGVKAESGKRSVLTLCHLPTMLHERYNVKLKK